MDILEINKILSNRVRLEILFWLKEPEKHFPIQHIRGHYDDGVCVQYIGAKSGLSISTISHYLSMMHKAVLLIPVRHGKWTYYKRNEKTILNYINTLKDSL